jgi:hypothetical protein
MSEDFVNNITLSYLISKNQLQKLNKKMKQTKEEAMKTDRELYRQQIISIFMELLESNDRASVNVLEEVKNGFDYFVEKTIYHIKMQEIVEERERTNGKHKEQITVTKSSSTCSDDIENKDAHDEEEIVDDEEEIGDDEEEIGDDEEEIGDDEEEIGDDEEEIADDEEENDVHKPKNNCNEKVPAKIVYKKHRPKIDWFDMVKMKTIY